MNANIKKLNGDILRLAQTLQAYADFKYQESKLLDKKGYDWIKETEKYFNNLDLSKLGLKNNLYTFNTLMGLPLKKLITLPNEDLEKITFINNF